MSALAAHGLIDQVSIGTKNNEITEQDQTNIHQDENDLCRKAQRAVHETYVAEVEVDAWPKDPDKLISFLMDFIRLPIKEYQQASTIEEVQNLSKTAAVGIEAYINEFGSRIIANREMENF